jgi:hypothetical protein
LGRRTTAASLVNFATLMAAGFAALTAMAYVERDAGLASFYLLMAAALLLSQVPHLAPGNRAARLLADAGIAVLSVNVIVHYGLRGLRGLNMYSLVAVLMLAAALGEALYVLQHQA